MSCVEFLLSYSAKQYLEEEELSENID